MQVLKKITACVSALSLIITSVSAFAYNDVPEDYRYGEAIAFLTNSGVVQGNGDGSFTPESLLSRAEFATMLDAAFEIEGEGTHSFEDVPQGAYYEKTVAKLVNIGVLSGKSEKLFAPDDGVTHEEAVEMIVKIYEYASGENMLSGVETLPYDYDDVSDWAQASMDKAMAYRIPLVSDGNTISPGAVLSRGEAAQLVANALLCLGEPKGQQGVEPTKIVQNKIGNVYYTTDAVELVISTDYSLVKYEVRDFYNTIVKKGYLKSREGEARIDLTELGIGHYSFAVYAPTDEAEQLCKTFFCIIDEYDFTDIGPEDAKFGVNTHMDNSWQGWSPEILELANIAGARIFRDASWWANVEREKGVYDSSLAKKALPYAKKYDMYAWDLTIQTNPLYDGGMTPQTEEGFEGQANFANALAELWDGRMLWIDILNEVEAVGTGPLGKEPITLYNNVKRCYEVVKANHPEVQISTTSAVNEWDEEFYKLGAFNYLDWVGVHNYPKNKVGLEEVETGSGPEKEIKKLYDNIKAMVDKYNTSGHEIKLSLNETGGHTANYSGGVTYREQAEYVSRIHAAALQAGYDNIIWYALMNDGHNENINEQNYGLLYSKNGKYGDWAPKESYQAYCVDTRKLSRAEVKETITDGNIYQYVFTTEDGKDLNVLNAVDGADVALYTDEPVKITNIMGKEEVYTPVNGKIYLNLVTEPVYIEGTVQVKEENLPVKQNVVNTIIDSMAKLSVEADGGLASENITAEFNGQEFGLGDTCDIETTKDTEAASIVTVVKYNGKPFARLYKNVDYKKPYDVEVSEKMSAGSDLNIVCDLEITATNNMDQDLTVSGIRYNFGDREGVIEVSGTISPHESAVWNYSFDKLTSGLVYNAKFNLVCGEFERDEDDFEGGYDYNIMPQGTMVIDGVVDEGLKNLENCLYIPPESMVMGLMKQNTITSAEDFSAQAWLCYDDNNVYMCVDVVDDYHSAPNTGNNIWSNDSIQFTFYGEGFEDLKYPPASSGDITSAMDNIHYYEFGVSLTDSGSTEKACWRDVANGTDPIREHAYQYVVKRNEATKHTVYELAVPWSTIYPLTSENVEDLRVSIAAIENDGNGRDGWYEWGGGICYEKNVDLFKHVHLLKK